MRLISVIAAFALATLLACGGGSGTTFTLSSGTYTLSNTSADAADNCNLHPSLPDGTRITLTVTATNVTFVFGAVNAARNPSPSLQGNTIGTDAKTFDFDNNTLTPPHNFNCIETDTLTILSGTLLANDQLSASLSAGAIPKGPAQQPACTPANLGYKTFPCSSTETFIAKKM